MAPKGNNFPCREPASRRSFFVAPVRLQLTRNLDIGYATQDAWGRTALHWAATYACEATVVLLLVRGAHPFPLSHGGEAQPRACPADLAAANGHAGIAAFLSEQALLRLAKDNNVSLDDSADAGARLQQCFHSLPWICHRKCYLCSVACCLASSLGGW